MAIHIRRREFIFTLGGAAAAWPLAARAQQRERMRRIGMLVGFAESDPESPARLAAFRHGLERLGWNEGRKFTSSIAGELAIRPACGRMQRS